MDAIKHYHPVVSFSFFLLLIVLSLVSMQPAFQVISFLAAACYAIAIGGARAFLRGSWWLLVLIVIVALFNGVFGGSGLTVLFTLNLGFMQTPITVESLTYGLCMGLMLANVILWFNILGKVSSLQGFIELFSKVSPTAGMIIARITVFIPELLAQARLVDRAQQVFVTGRGAVGSSAEVSSAEASSAEGNSAAGDSAVGNSAQGNSAQGNSAAPPFSPPSSGGQGLATLSTSEKPTKKRLRREQLVYAGVLSSYLMEWGMEKSLITAQSMVARGYGSRKRTSYRRTRLALRDIVPLVILLALGLTSLGCIIWASTTYQFYPYLSQLQPWLGYIPFLLLILMPVILQLSEELAWWRSR